MMLDLFMISFYPYRLKNDNLGIWSYIKQFCSKDIISTVENFEHNSISQMKKYFSMGIF